MTIKRKCPRNKVPPDATDEELLDCVKCGGADHKDCPKNTIFDRRTHELLDGWEYDRLRNLRLRPHSGIPRARLPKG